MIPRIIIYPVTPAECSKNPSSKAAARMGRAQFHRARFASTGMVPATPPLFQRFASELVVPLALSAHPDRAAH
jgi:hypothetical protein